MGRTVLAVVAGLVVALLAMVSVEFLALQLWPPPPGFVLEDEADLARLVALATPAKMAAVVFGWALASFLGGWVAARLSHRHRIGAAVAIGVLVVAGVVFNAANIPHPMWMNVLGVLLPLPLALLAARLATKRAAPAAA
jgi:hypothetical protein